MRPLSVSARLLIAASLVLVAFLGLTGLTLDRAFRDSVAAAVRERLEVQIFMLLGAANFGEGRGDDLMPDSLPDPRFSTPGSGLYAQVLLDDGSIVWRSRSMLGMSMPLPQAPPPGAWVFGRTTASDGAPLLSLMFTATWEPAAGRPVAYTFHVAEARALFDSQIAGFRRSLWGWLGGVAAVLLAAQGAILHWGLRPLRDVAQEVADIEAGRREAIGGDYPPELQRLAGNLNALIRNREANLERYRHSLADLAHSLKTPLAVLRSAVESRGPREELDAAVRDQVERLNQAVDYQLQRAAASGRKALAAPIAVAPLVARVLQSLAKVYAEKSLGLEADVPAGLRFHGDEGDLLEIVGNLADNACKWADKRVKVSARTGEGMADFVLTVDDDGPGIPPEQIEHVLARGARADPSTDGHGIGLAVVREIVTGVYGGRLELGRNPEGGARVRVRI